METTITPTDTMTNAHDTLRVAEPTPPAPRSRPRSSSRRIAVTLAALSVAAVSAAFLVGHDDSPTPAATRPAASAHDDEVLRDLVNRGLVPRQALEPSAPSAG